MGRLIDRLKAENLAPRVLGDLLGLDQPAQPGAIRCVYPDRHKNNDASPSLVIAKDGASAKCQACGFGGGLLDVAMDRLDLADRKAAAAELERRYLPSSRRASRRKAPLGRPEATYDYESLDGTVRYRVLRFARRGKDGTPSKTFRIQRPTRNGPRWGLGGEPPIPFRWPQVHDAAERGATIYVAEGEKDVLALEAAGVAATCNHGGAGKWRSEHTEALRCAAHAR